MPCWTTTGRPSWRPPSRSPLARDACGAGSVAYFLERRRRTLRQLPPVPVVLPADPRVRDLDVPSHALETYDALIPAADPPDAV
jgi:hypothetical protein